MTAIYAWLHDNASTIADIGMGGTALYLTRQLTVAVRALTSAVTDLKAGHVDHEGRLQALETRRARAI